MLMTKKWQINDRERTEKWKRNDRERYLRRVLSQSRGKGPITALLLCRGRWCPGGCGTGSCRPRDPSTPWPKEEVTYKTLTNLATRCRNSVATLLITHQESRMVHPVPFPKEEDSGSKGWLRGTRIRREVLKCDVSYRVTTIRSSNTPYPSYSNTP